MKNRMNGEEELDLSVFENMNVMSLGSNCIQGMRNLTMNGLNELSEFEIGSGSLNMIEWIEIGSNSLNSLSSFDMSGFVNMRGLLIGSDSLSQIESLRLNKLEMVEIGSGSVGGVNVLEIGSNSLNSIDYNTLDLRPFVNAKRIRISWNSLKNVESIVVNPIPSLIELSIGFNSLSKLRR